MDSLKEFLETSTIHGLAYTSTAPSKLSKGFWFLVVIAGFSSAFYLINDSYNDWQASPIATSISTHPISMLEFPLVTICPPEGSNTALNYDLVRAQNITLTERDRDALANETTHFLIDQPSRDFVHFARSLMNEENILEIFERKPTFAYPLAYNDKDDKKSSFEIWSSKLNGSYKTPGFGENHSCNETAHSVHFVLQLPLVGMKEADDAVLDIRIETKANVGWNVQYREGVKYYIFSTTKKSWQDAENFCMEKGGHLASVKNIMDRVELDTGTLSSKTWIGGTDRAKEDVWVWPDGTPLGERVCSTIDVEKGDLFEPCNRWADKYPKGGEAQNCLSVIRGSWYSDDCSEKKPFACQIDPSHMSGNENQTLKLGDVDFVTIELWLQKRVDSKTETCDTSTALPGFSFIWTTRNSRRSSSQIFDVSKVAEKAFGQSKVHAIQMYLNVVSKRVRYNIVRRSKQYNMTNTEIWDMVKSWKREVIRKKLVTCASNVVRSVYLSELFIRLEEKIPTNRSKVTYKETNDDLILAFDIFSYMIFCQHEAMELQIFFETLMMTGNTQSVLQAVMNNVKLDFEEESIDKAEQHIFNELSKLLDLKLTQILMTMYDPKSIEMALKSNDKALAKKMAVHCLR